MDRSAAGASIWRRLIATLTSEEAWMNRTIPLALLGLALSAAACGSLGDPHARGKKALEQGDYGTAIEAYGLSNPLFGPLLPQAR